MESGGKRSGDRQSLGQRLSGAGARVEDEVRRIVRAIDEEVVPEIRRDGTAALRSVAGQLDRLARYMDDHRGVGPSRKP